MHGRHALDSPIPGLLETIFRYWRKTDALSQRLAWIHFWEVLAHLLLPYAPAESARRVPESIAYAARELLEADLSPRLSIQEQLATLGFSYAHVSRLFRRAFGTTPGEYRNTLRLERAKALLRNTRRTVAEIAYEAGFEDPAYFTRLFRRYNGISPSQFR